MRIKIAALQTTLLFLLVLSPLTQAKDIFIGVTQQAPDMAGMERPENGLSKEEVSQQYGPPQEMTDPVGNPPISRWTYQNYSVYFENNTVLHAVLRHIRTDNNDE